jgi:hypothetical protein
LAWPAIGMAIAAIAAIAPTNALRLFIVRPDGS